MNDRYLFKAKGYDGEMEINFMNRRVKNVKK